MIVYSSKRKKTEYMRIGAIVILSLLLGSGMCSQAPDFVVTDTDGATHHLYQDYLSEERAVVLGLFFAECALCDDLLPLLDQHYTQSWSQQFPVDVLMLSGVDADTTLLSYAEAIEVNLKMVGSEGGAWDAMQPYMDSNDWGMFYGFPMFVIIGPEGDVIYDPWGSSLENTMEMLGTEISSLFGTPTSINESELDDFNLILTSAYFDFQAERAMDVEVMNLQGQVIKSWSNQFHVHFSSEELSSGMFLVRFRYGDRSASRNWMIQH